MNTIKTIISALVMLATFETYGQVVAIPDSNFGNWLNANGYSSCLTGNGTIGWQLDASCSAVTGSNSMYCDAAHIRDLTGIQYFRNLSTLSCVDNALTSLPTLPAFLYMLKCDQNPLDSLTALPASLTILTCSYDSLSVLPTLPGSLTSLLCNNNLISTLPTLPASLLLLDCSNNPVTSLPALPVSMITLGCGDNLLTALPTPLPDSLQSLDCQGNTITNMPALPAGLTYLNFYRNHISSLGVLPDSLQTLICDSNLMTALPALPASLTYLMCGAQGITALPALPASLAHLDCNGALIDSLPVLPAALTYLECASNLLTALPALPSLLNHLNCGYNMISDLPYLPDSITFLWCNGNASLSCLPRIFQDSLGYFAISGTNINCLPNHFISTYYDINPATMSLCAPGNVNGCNSVLTTGYIVWPGDADNNWVVDNNDLLPIGLGYDSTGPARTVQTIVWQADSAGLWSDSFTNYPYPVNTNHADCNGDGIINANDTAAISANFSLTHNKTRGMNSPWRNGIPGITLQFSKDTVVAGDTLVTSLLLGDSVSMVSNIYGLAFTFNYDPLIVDSTQSGFTFVSSWMGNSANSININRDFKSTGTVMAAITGIDHTPRSGSGLIAQYSAVVTTGNINGKNYSYYTNLSYISAITALDQHGNAIALNDGIDSDVVAYYPNGINAIAPSPHLNIYPNPATNEVRITAGTAMNEIIIIDILGKEVYKGSANSRQSETIDISMLEQGVYIVRVSATGGTATAKLVVSR